MGILGIENRTENWKTAQEFAPFIGPSGADARARLAQKLAENHGLKMESSATDVSMELFWVGMRDFMKNREDKGNERDLAERYKSLFSDLRSKIQEFRSSSGLSFAELGHNGYMSDSPDQRQRLYSNLFNTEIDIVLESPAYLFVGEAKHESGFGASGRDVLVHQLIREYVMASLLIDLRKIPAKQVIPFVVWSGKPNHRNPVQVEFMMEQGWLKEGNVLGWKTLQDIASQAS